MNLRLFGLVSKCFFFLIVMAFIITTILPPPPPPPHHHHKSLKLGFLDYHDHHNKYLEVPQIVWGLNNQKIAFARAALTARFLNRALIMPSLSASLFYKETRLLQPISFDKVFHFDKFNSLCKGFVQLAPRYSDHSSDILVVQKGSGRRWTIDKDLHHLKELNKTNNETIRIDGKNPFLWHDHWPVKDYARVFECMVFVDEISKEADKVVAKINELGAGKGYVAVHMRIEKDWMIHCKKRQHRLNVSEICSSKDEIMTRVANIPGLKTPTVVYLAVADALVVDDQEGSSSILNGWREGLQPVEKKKLGVVDIYNKHPYLIQAAIDYQVCLRADVFVGNSYSTFSSLLVLERSVKMVRLGGVRGCGMDAIWPSYAYNLKLNEEGEDSPRPWSWMSSLSDSSLKAISYGSNNISC